MPSKIKTESLPKTITERNSGQKKNNNRKKWGDNGERRRRSPKKNYNWAKVHFWSHIFCLSCRFGPVLHFWSHIFGLCCIIGLIYFGQIAEFVLYLWVRCRINLIYIDHVRLAIKLFVRIWDQFCNLAKRYGIKSNTRPDLQCFAKIWD